MAPVETQNAQQDEHGWLCTENLKTRFGDFAFRNGYPDGDTAQRLFELQKLNRAVEVYTTQLMRVADLSTREGLRAFGAGRANQLVIWEGLMGPDTVLLTANTETVYGITHLDLKADGATVVEVPPHMLGAMQDALQRHIIDIGPLGPDKGQGGKLLILPPDFEGEPPDGYIVARSPTYGVTAFMRGFQVDGSTAHAVALMKQARVYPLKDAAAPAPTEFLNGSGKPIDTVFPDNAAYFNLLAMLVDEEPAELFDPLERFQMQAIGIAKGQPFKPDDKARALLEEAARLGGAIARANTYASSAPDVPYYRDRYWQQTPSGLDYTFFANGVPQVDARNNVYYMAAGNSPGMMAKNVGQGSQYLWTYRDAGGDFLDGARNYRLHVLPDVPINNFWSVVVYDALSRSELKSDQPLPSVSMYSGPAKNDDGSVDIYFGPTCPAGQETNWIQTVPGKGWFPIFRFYGPLEPFFDRSWKLQDIEPVG